MLTDKERLNRTLSFEKCEDRGSVMETFYPWTLTIERWLEEGLPAQLDIRSAVDGHDFGRAEEAMKYLDCGMTDGVAQLEVYFGFDSLRRIFFKPPFFGFPTKTLEETDTYVVKAEEDGWVRKYWKDSGLVTAVSPAVGSWEDWTALKKMGDRIQEQHYTKENFARIYGKYAQGSRAGQFEVRLTIWGFFWTGFQLLGAEQHLMAMYDCPELLCDIGAYLVKLYTQYLDVLLDILPVDTIFINEDISGKNGPMIGPGHFEQFVGQFYRQLVPFLKAKGVRHIIVDTDGDFAALIPAFMDVGVEGFVPMDVNAGMDIVRVREQYPSLKFLGAFNKLEIAKGKDAIEREFERILPVIRQGGYIPGCDHQVAPSTSLENYKYYIRCLAEVMKQSGTDC